MNTTVNSEEYTLRQLREWLRALNRPISGTKAVLALRLSEIPAEERGNCPDEVEYGNIDTEDEDDNAGNDNVSNDKAGNENAGELNDENFYESVEAGDDEAVASAGSMELRLLRKELEIVKKERELLAKENKILSKIASADKRSDKREVCEMPLPLLREFMSDFDGSGDVAIWTAQINNLIRAYKVDEETARALFVSKLKGKAQKWLYSMPDFATQSVQMLVKNVEQLFGTKINKITMRKQFEMRKWREGEKFSEYCNEKSLLAATLNMEEDEMVEYIIDGIPDPYLRTQANMLCLTTKSELLQAYAKVMLKPKSGTAAKTDGSMKCFNCNSMGHRAAECKKPKREPGSCYGCGSFQHRVAECPDRKKPVMIVEQDDDYDYVRYLTFYLEKYKSICFKAECLVDSGSPISFVKQRCIKKVASNILKCSNEISYVGLNKSKLEVYGKINFYVDFNSKCICVELLVVANESMGYDVVLGRDFMKKCNVKLVSKSNEEEQEQSYDTAVKFKNSYEARKDKQNSESAEKKIYLENNDENMLNKANENTIEKNIEYDDCLQAILTIEVEPYGKLNLNINENVNVQYAHKLNEIFKQFYVKPVRPEAPRTKYELKLALIDQKPFYCSPRRLSHVEKLELQKLLDEYLLKGYIRESSSEYASPVVLVKKKTGDIRMCIDFRALNKVIARDNYPLPLIEDLIDKLGKKVYFTKLDLKNGFFHVAMDKDSCKFTSFVTPLGQFEFLVLPFGLKVGPPAFQRFVNLVFGDMIREDKIIVYMDDILIATETIEEHFDVLTKTFQRIVENKLELRIDKCEFLQTRITYLGYTVTKSGIQPNDKGIEAVKNFPIPQNVHSVQSFLGLCSYFRKFVKDFSHLAKPLQDLIKKRTVFKFGDEEITCFELLKKKLIDAPVLAIYDPSDETELHCDASSSGFGAILMQKKKDGKMHPIFYFSKRTSETESKYHSFELEALAIIYALRRFRIYLQGKKFKIITDCHSLSLTLSKRDLNPRIERWALELQNYDFSVEHRPGVRMQHVDALSRHANVLVVQSTTLEENLIICQGKDPILCNIINDLEKQEHKLYELRNGVLYRKTDKDNVLFYVPKDMEIQIIHKCHDDMGHVGVNKTLDLIKNTYWFPKAKEKVESYIQNCLKCIAYSYKNNSNQGFLNNIPKNNVPFEVVHIDHYGPIENNSRSKKHILVVIDAFTKFVRLYAAKTTKSKEAIDALQDYFRTYSRPKCIVSDRGTCFTSAEFEEFLSKNNVQHIKIATGSPKANGQVERINKIIGPMISKLADNNKKVYWENTLPKVEFALNNTICRSVNKYPSVLLFGVKQKGEVVDEFKENFMWEIDNGVARDLEKFRKEAAEQQTKVQNYNKTYYDQKRRTPYEYAVGDYIMLKNFETQQNGPKKLIPKYKGPYKISKVLRHDRFVVEDVDNFQQTNIPYRGVWALENIRPWRQVKGS